MDIMEIKELSDAILQRASGINLSVSYKPGKKMSHYAMKVYFQERIWLYFFIWRQPDSEEAEGFRTEPGE